MLYTHVYKHLQLGTHTTIYIYYTYILTHAQEVKRKKERNAIMCVCVIMCVRMYVYACVHIPGKTT